MSDPLIFSESPTVTFATNTFLRVPVILQEDESPLIEIVQTEGAGFTTKFHIQHPDGTDLAVVVGSRLFLLPDGKKAGLKMRHPAGRTVCELGDQTLFEIQRREAAALSTEAELYTRSGSFIKAPSDIPFAAFDTKSREEFFLEFGQPIFVRNTVKGGKVGVGITTALTGARTVPSPEHLRQRADIQAMLRQVGDSEAAELLDRASFGLNHFEDCEIGIQLRSGATAL